MQAVRSACAEAGLDQEAIRRRLDELDARIYTPVGHPALAQRNMLVMNALGVRVSDHGADRPGHRTDRVVLPTMPAGPYAETAIRGELELVPPAHGTAPYIPVELANKVTINHPLALPEPTGEIERHPGEG
jgi:hypothetical protein